MLLKNHINHSPRLLIKLIPLVDHTKITVIIIYDSEDLASMAPLLRIVSSVNHFHRPPLCEPVVNSEGVTLCHRVCSNHHDFHHTYTEIHHYVLGSGRLDEARANRQ